MTHPAAPVVQHRLADLADAVHDERSLADDGLVDRLAAQQERGGVLLAVDAEAFAVAIEEPDLRRAEF